MVGATRPDGIYQGLDHVVPEELRSWLEWAGSKLLAYGGKSPYPAGLRSNWPSYAPDPNVAYGYSNERLRPAIPNSHEIEVMDLILSLPSLAKEIPTRQVLNARALVTPISNRYLYSWSKIAFVLHTNRHNVKRLHANGLIEVAQRVTAEQTSTIRPLVN